VWLLHVLIYVTLCVSLKIMLESHACLGNGIQTLFISFYRKKSIIIVKCHQTYSAQIFILA
jgi:hypothetical protein